MRSQPPAVSEAQLQDQVVHVAKLFGWRVFHPWLSIRSAEGFPDLVMVRLSRIIFAELKSDKGRLTPAQQAWRDDLERTGKVEVYVWRPGDWSEILEVLR